jgi:uncharacterized protein YacL
MIPVLGRTAFILACGTLGGFLSPLAPPGFPGWGTLGLNVATGLALGALAVMAECSLRSVPLRVLLGAVAGLLAGAAIGSVLLGFLPAAPRAGGGVLSPALARPLLLLVLAYAGAVLGAAKASRFRPRDLRALFKESEQEESHRKILDTSVIIDGRIADVAETGFLDGTLVLPQFVLRELQYVADSSDPLKRNRGRKGLDILQTIKRNPNVRVEVTETDFPGTREVDQKLIELARRMRAKILTNDFNLNKVAQLNGIEVLNINELANSLKPVILPGETMKVFIVKEGKEHDQGVAYLDDGTMVVVNAASRQVGRTVDVTITSVVQTAAGKMFFGRCLSDNERNGGRRPQRERAAE